MAVVPGREAQIERLNEARNTSVPASQTASTTTTQSPANNQPAQPSTPVSSHKSLLGVNLDKLNTLESIQFQSGLKLGGQMGGEMYNSIAYIRYWKKKSDAETTQSSEQVVENAESYTCLPSSLLWGPEALKLSFPFTEQTLGQSLADSSYAQSSLPGSALSSSTLDPSFSLNLNGGSANPNVPQTNPTTPGSSSSPAPAPGTPPSAAVPVSSLQPTDYAVNSNFFKSCPKLNGTVASANPNGGFNGFVRRFLGLQYQNRVTYQGMLSKDESGGYGVNYERQEFDVEGSPGTKTSNLPGLGVWQFLFNPEEIDWEGGPEYGESETWGVMGDDNAGRPLFWKYMKNQRLTFSKVLLNGYVFGKRVDSLEKGLKDLFMEDAGDNPNGPPALEFVWGDRVYGPCVIRDVKIKEKNWDNGYLVNAEVSFTLEKIPKWVINDGEVDVARPSSQSIAPELFNPPPETEGDDGEGEDREERRTDAPPADRSLADKIKKCTAASRGKTCMAPAVSNFGGFAPPTIKRDLVLGGPTNLSLAQVRSVDSEVKRIQPLLNSYAKSIPGTNGALFKGYKLLYSKYVLGNNYATLSPFDPSIDKNSGCNPSRFASEISRLEIFFSNNLSKKSLLGVDFYPSTGLVYYRSALSYQEDIRKVYDKILKCSRAIESNYSSKYRGFNCDAVKRDAIANGRAKAADFTDCNK